MDTLSSVFLIFLKNLICIIWCMKIPRKVNTFRGRILYHGRGKWGAFILDDIASNLVHIVSKCRKINGLLIVLITRFSCHCPSSAVYGAKSNRRGSGLRRFAHCTESTRCRKLGGFWCFSLPHNKKWGKRENGWATLFSHGRAACYFFSKWVIE